MKKIILSFLCVFFCACFNEESVGKVGSKSIEILAKNMQGENIKLSNSKANLKVLVFFQNGCSSCLEELPRLDKFVLDNKNKIEVFAINSTDSKEVVQVIAEQLGLKNVYILKDDLKLTSQKYGIYATPTTIIIKDNLIKERILGEKPWKNIESKLVSFL
ncbi:MULTISPECIES: TlpA family protein disulfide reductase [unclassified Campylobacter]|uniref:TlpA family protein disulfide reductase n=1 Tax=unclassified Campylobacter TaxID=2593542 RepID=UPI001237A395|nr:MULTISPECIES: TlpA disulfide reductase family protein [unclassified Campylobacter]KAA6227291.1 TlpA family protein disulfide reductase [Campylobacter sp. LR286c]KAA6227835.1 TlpA family protein disulfide reductase [Campylobacter sp. LR185c]KAA6228243.1 TlpA family protein disulfide reductase [Campylobacter sp. LR196d]KAA6229243.1 TlpA family protein disulfide reductase [Campylobacter sp. LR291e]KAA6231048.1 TlpA family protein disulfide reductase [Campylobacter sp. LR264d]